MSTTHPWPADVEADTGVPHVPSCTVAATDANPAVVDRSTEYVASPTGTEMVPDTVADDDVIDEDAREPTVAVESRPSTVTGVLWSSPSAAPICPAELLPQHFTAAVIRSAHVCACPAVTSTTCAPREATCTGDVFFTSGVPSPTCPSELLPQHHSSPLLVSAHTWFEPAATFVTFAASDTAVGVEFDAVARFWAS